MAPSLSVVFPMHNEEAYVRRAVAAAREGAGAVSEDFEIVIVDDASTDRTREIAEALSREDTRIRVLHESRRRGLGATLRAGYAAATRELVLYSDADLPFEDGAFDLVCAQMVHAISRSRISESVGCRVLISQSLPRLDTASRFWMRKPSSILRMSRSKSDVCGAIRTLRFFLPARTDLAPWVIDGAITISTKY